MTQFDATTLEGFLDARQTAQRGERWIVISALVGALGLLFAAGQLITPINRMRQDYQLELSDESLRGLPPDIALLTKTGTFRALAIDLAFIRLERLKENNRFSELMQLSDWLCKLAPRYPTVWSYSAWNMAYNISVSQYTAEARWLWVRNGIENLRNRGLRYNPKAIKLYRELAWIFYHKVGDKLDDFHMQYKAELATEMTRLLGEPPATVDPRVAIDQMREIRDAPRDVQAWIDTHPDAQRLVDQLASVQLNPDAQLLDFVAQNLREYTDVSILEQRPDTYTEPTLREQRRAVLTDEAMADTTRTLLAALRSDIIRNRLNMNLEWMVTLMDDPPWMAEVKDDYTSDQLLCPIDWRLPYAHTLYWSTYGDMVTRGVFHVDPSDSMNTVRFIFFALKSMAHSGRLIFEPNFNQPNQSFVQMLPDIRFIHHMHEAYLKFGFEQFKDDPRIQQWPAGPNYKSGHISFLHGGIRHLYIEGGETNMEMAKKYFAFLYQFDRMPDGSVKPQYDVPFEKYVFTKIFEAAETQHNAIQFISTLIERSQKDLIEGDTEACMRHLATAKRIRDWYSRDLEYDRNARRQLEPLTVMWRDVALVIMMRADYSPLQKKRLWDALDWPFRKQIYESALPYIETQCALYDPPLDPAKVLPRPADENPNARDPQQVFKTLERYDVSHERGEKKNQG